MRSPIGELEPSVIDRLLGLGGGKLLGQLAVLFEEQTQERLQALREGFESGDADRVERAAHALKGIAGNLGASRLLALSARLEELAASRRLDAVAVVELLAEAEEEVAGVTVSLGALLAADSPGDRGGASPATAVRQNVAVIEDNPDNRLLVRLMLEQDYEIEEYEDGLAGLSGIESTPPDIVLLDISLPGMDGTEVLQHIRRHDRLRGLPVVALTAHAMTGDRERFLELGFDEYVSKPILDEDGFIGIVEKLLRGQGGRR